jgi:hypothetical protein
LDNASVIQSFATSKTEEFKSFFLTHLNGIGTVISRLRDEAGRLVRVDGFPSGVVATTSSLRASLAMMTAAGKLA